MAGSTRAIFYALGANFSIFLAKSAAAVVTGSGAMLAEAVHSLADCGNQGLLLFGMRQTKRPATPDTPLGFGKAIYFWSFVVALTLFSAGGLFSLYEGLHKLQHPAALSYPWLAIGVLVFSMLAEGTALRTCLKVIRQTRGERSLWQWFRTTRQADLAVILGEDTAALVGLSIALLAISLTFITGNPLYDALGTLAIGALLIVVALFLGIEIQAMLIGQSVSPPVAAQMRRFLEDRPETAEVYNVITLQMGPDVMVAIKARMSESSDAGVLIADINRVEAAFKENFPQVRWSFFEPDVAD